MFWTYLRLVPPFSDSDTQVLKRASKVLKDSERFSRDHRKARHTFYKQLLEYQRDNDQKQNVNQGD